MNQFVIFLYNHFLDYFEELACTLPSYTFLTPLFHICNTFITLLWHQLNTFVTLLLQICYTFVTPLDYTFVTPLATLLLHPLLHQCYTFLTPLVTPLLQKFYTFVTSLVVHLLHLCNTHFTHVLHPCYTFVTPLLHLCYTFVTPLVTPSLHCCNSYYYTFDASLFCGILSGIHFNGYSVFNLINRIVLKHMYIMKLFFFLNLIHILEVLFRLCNQALKNIFFVFAYIKLKTLQGSRLALQRRWHPTNSKPRWP